MAQTQPLPTALDPTSSAIVHAHAAHDDARRAWAASPGSTRHFNAYLRARLALQAATRQDADEPETTPGGPLVLTPVVEWWHT